MIKTKTYSQNSSLADMVLLVSMTLVTLLISDVKLDTREVMLATIVPLAPALSAACNQNNSISLHKGTPKAQLIDYWTRRL